MEDANPFCGPTDSSIIDFWWRLPPVSKLGWIPHSCALSHAYNGSLRFTSCASLRARVFDPEYYRHKHKEWWCLQYFYLSILSNNQFYLRKIGLLFASYKKKVKKCSMVFCYLLLIRNILEQIVQYCKICKKILFREDTTNTTI